MAKLFSKSGDHDQTASDVGLHWLLIILLGVSTLKLVNQNKKEKLQILVVGIPIKYYI